MVDAVTDSPEWIEEQKGLRRKEVRTARLTLYIQAGALVIALVAAGTAAWAAKQAGDAVRQSAQYDAQQAIENQLTTAVSAIGGTSSAEQVAGLILLRRNVAIQVNDALSSSGNPLTRENALDAFDTSMEVIGDFMQSEPMTDTSLEHAVDPRAFGPGYGYTTAGAEPQSVIYAADQLHLLLGMANEVRRIDGRQPPNIDLSDVELYDASLPGIDFGWLGKAWMPDIDLRGSNLHRSIWGRGTTLRHAYLQCADLSGADFRGVDLTNANLSGANISGANFTGAILHGAVTKGAFGHAQGLVATDAASTWRPLKCLLNMKVMPKKPKVVPKKPKVSPKEQKARRRRSRA